MFNKLRLNVLVVEKNMKDTCYYGRRMIDLSRYVDIGISPLTNSKYYLHNIYDHKYINIHNC